MWCTCSVASRHRPRSLAAAGASAATECAVACRFYADPCPRKQPGIYAIRSLLLHYAASSLLHVYLDLHAHANRQGVFAYGNALSGAAHLEALLFCKLAALNSPYFDFSGCNFSERNMASRDRDGTSKDGTGRVALHRASQLPLLYTVEANYNRSRHMPEVPAAAGARAADASPVHAVRAPERFDAGTFHQVRADTHHSLTLPEVVPVCAGGGMSGNAVTWMCARRRTSKLTKYMHPGAWTR